MRAQGRAEGRDPASQLVGTWLASLVEPVGPAVHPTITTPSTPAYRLSRAGQFTLGLAMALLALLLYGQTLAANQGLSKRFQFCQPLPLAESTQSEGVQQAQSLINHVAKATPGQKLRLRQQSSFLLRDSARLCDLAALNHSQQVALMTVAAAALCLLGLTVALGLSHELVHHSSRTLRTMQVTAVFLLVVPMLSLQLGEQVRNTSLYLQLYLAHHNLHQQMLSALANQDLPALSAEPTPTKGMALRMVPPLTTSAAVAQLIRGIDAQMQSLPPVPLNFNDSTVTRVYGWLSTGLNGVLFK